jgi:hypothetical protein
MPSGSGVIAKALKVCKKEPKKQRACLRQAGKKYAMTARKAAGRDRDRDRDRASWAFG